MAIQALDRRYISFARLEAKLKALFPDCTTLKIAVAPNDKWRITVPRLLTREEIEELQVIG